MGHSQFPIVTAATCNQHVRRWMTTHSGWRYGNIIRNCSIFPLELSPIESSNSNRPIYKHLYALESSFIYFSSLHIYTALQWKLKPPFSFTIKAHPFSVEHTICDDDSMTIWSGVLECMNGECGIFSETIELWIIPHFFLVSTKFDHSTYARISNVLPQYASHPVTDATGP